MRGQTWLGNGVRGIAARALGRDAPTILLHVGDLDPSGESIFEAMAADAAAFVEAAPLHDPRAPARFGELAALRWSDIDWHRELIHVRQALARAVIDAPKSGKVRSVPMAPEVAQALARLGQREWWTGDDDFVFIGPCGK
jgi:hypothetical protein